MSETLTRAISGAVYIAILLTACWYSEWSFKILIGIFLVLATVEFAKLIKFNTISAVVRALIVYVIFVISDFFESRADVFFTLFSILTAIWLIKKLFSPENLIIKENYKGFVFAGYITFPFITIAKIPFFNGHYESYIIILIFLMIWINDTFAYLVGKSFGKHKLFEKISPKKTIEGFLGGALFTIIFSFFIPTIFGWDNENTIWKWVVISIIVVIFATLGDLVESKFKRSANVKDSGNIMPGHGGILDRLDSIIFVAPFIFLFYQILSYVS